MFMWILVLYVLFSSCMGLNVEKIYKCKSMHDVLQKGGRAVIRQ